MNYAQLRAFHAVASQGSYTKAAEMLHVTQPTLSDHVKSLEERYGVKLFRRQGRGVVLTGLGRALLEITRRQSYLEAEAEQLLSRAQGLVTGKISVTADSPYLVVPLLGDFYRRYPGIELTVQFGNSERVLQDLYELRADIGLMPESIDDSRLHALAYRKDQIVILVPRGHEWARRSSIHFEELNERRLILREKGSNTRAIFEQAMRRHDIRAGTILEIGSREGVREAVAAGLGIGLISDSEVGNDSRLHPIRIRDAALNLTEYFVCLREAYPMPAVRAFFELVETRVNAPAGGL
ncbi:transcriptional regulator [Marinobacterium nitratireducens]|uniref:Transcriptional regulator n=1 Tax=Marinobacterium nitratireducens TaxID=518897 RepID=A0A917Z527_9GAMM|nr:LysR substrate-binding domain-containing protein [Marinobacterium nitratireducens]GGO75403.1 transcriptional regulator [Marinobacterium nitratireducens]